MAERVVLVTGATSGIGFATAERFAADGATVVGVDLRPGTPDGIAFLECDVTDAAAVEATIAEVIARHGRLDARHGPLTRFDDNLTGPFHTIRAALPHLRAVKGNIVNVASVAGVQGQAYTAAYCASKGGLVMLTKSLAVELSAEGVRVNCVCPGAVETPLVAEVGPLIPADADPRLLGRLMMLMSGITQPSQIAAAVAYLASDAASMITGHALVIDGGQSV